jgi:hypothetical protein
MLFTTPIYTNDFANSGLIMISMLTVGLLARTPYFAPIYLVRQLIYVNKIETMKKLTVILVVAAVAGGAAWLFGTDKGKKVLGDIKDSLDDSATKLKSSLDAAKNAGSDLIAKSKKYVHSNGVKESVS